MPIIDGGGANGAQGPVLDGAPLAPFAPPKAPLQQQSSLVTIVTICNQALGRIGVSSFIQDINERSLEAAVCKQFYDSARDRCLEAFPWNFADTFVQLQDIGNPPPGWGYRYRYPINCAKAREVLMEDAAKYAARGFTTPAAKFAVIGDEANGGKAIICNLKAPVLRYTAKVQNPSLFSASFVDALAWLLASDIAAPLAKPEYGKAAADAYSVVVLRAGTDSMNEGNAGNVTQNQESEFLRARR